MKVGVLFPWYGSQYVGMGKELYDNSRVMQEYFEEAASCLNINFVKLCFASSQSELAKIGQGSQALFVVSSALYALLQEQHVPIEPLFFAGYNGGEYAALHAAGCVNVPDGLYLLSKYAQLYTELLEQYQYTFVRVSGISFDHLEKVCAQVRTAEAQLFPALELGPAGSVVMGSRDAIATMKKLLKQDYVDASIQEHDPLFSGYSSLMEPVTEQLKVYMGKVDFKDMEHVYMSNTTQEPITKGAQAAHMLVRNMLEPCTITKALSRLPYCDLYVQVGPGTAVADMFAQQYPERTVIAINTQEDIDRLKKICETSASGDYHGI
jgi:[acyl-carrier-protein] S-malonyltransferase